MARSLAYYRGYVDAQDWVKTMDQFNTPSCPFAEEWARREYCAGWNEFWRERPNG